MTYKIGINSILVNEYELLVLMHAMWRSWLHIRNDIYKALNVKNVESLISKVLDLQKVEPRKDQLNALLRAITKTLNDVSWAREELSKLRDLKVQVIPFFSPFYPRELLKYQAQGSEYIYPPLVLYTTYANFNLNEKPIIAVVGTRRCSIEGRNLARQIGQLIASKNFRLATGLAEGIDIEATLACLEKGGQVVGVRPWLIPIFKEANKLKKTYENNLMLIAENPWKPKDINIKKLYFLRNRIISGMARLVVVVEAMPNGGSMHQIELALKRGKPVAIYKPRQGTPYWKAYEKYVKKDALPFEDINKLETILDNLAN